MQEYIPRKFFWGSATSAHQVEGKNVNDWSEWEKKNAQRLAETSLRQIRQAHRKQTQGKPFDSARGKLEYILNRYPNPLQKENYISGRACDHYNRYEEDFDLAQALGHNAHRFSIEWSRVEPEEGVWSESEIAHYRDVIRALRARGMEPFVTLWHFTLPLWLAQKGGVVNNQFSKYFARYAEKMVKELGDVTYWITLNEPLVFASQGYLRGTWPPEKRNPLRYVLAIQHLIRAHRDAYQAIHRVRHDATVGIAKHVIVFRGPLRMLKNWWWNTRFVDAIRTNTDFIGINYYFGNCESTIKSDMGWDVCPDGMYHAIRMMTAYGKPLYITENGVADAEDSYRAEFIREHVKWIAKFNKEVRPVKSSRDSDNGVNGYFYWSLLDNFEWDKGFWPRFGLIEVDYQTMKRTVRKSAWEYKRIIEL